MLLDNPLDAGAEDAEVVDVTRVGDHGRGQSLGLGTGLAMVRLVEEIANVRVSEQDLVHAIRDGRPTCFQRRHGFLDELNGPVTQSISHLVSPGDPLVMVEWARKRSRPDARVREPEHMPIGSQPSGADAPISMMTLLNAPRPTASKGRALSFGRC